MHFKSVLITGSRAVGGLNSFARDLAIGFSVLQIPVRVVEPGSVLRELQALRDPSVLKILSTSAVFCAPICRSVICVSHGVPRVDAQGWVKFIGILLSLKIASYNSVIIGVSSYVASHLAAIFNIKVDGVIYNPFLPLEYDGNTRKRQYLTYVGRLDKVKNVDKFIDALKKFLVDHPSYTVAIIGEGTERHNLEKLIAGHPSIFMFGSLSKSEVIDILRQTKIFFSGCVTEAFGITYLEALSCGCNIVLPLFGAGAEVLSPFKSGDNIVFVSDLNDQSSIYSAFEKAENAINYNYDLSGFFPETIAQTYLEFGGIRR